MDAAQSSNLGMVVPLKGATQDLLQTSLEEIWPYESIDRKNMQAP